MKSPSSPQSLSRELGTFGAVITGLGSIIGTGVFVSIGIGAGIAGPAVILAVIIGALVAICNGLSSAQLAANHAVSGGTYEYGYRYLNPWLGFIAGWMFLVAKTASAATAALGFAGYVLSAVGVSNREWRVAIALLAVLVLTGIVLQGIQRSNLANRFIVSISLITLVFLVIAGIPPIIADGGAGLLPASGTSPSLGSILQASALMFVAYTGYGRIATLGEEVREPRTTIPRAIVVTMMVVMALYLSVAIVGVGLLGAEGLSEATQTQAAPLEMAARQLNIPGAPQFLAVGAIAAMLGVLLNLILGLSRVVMAMGRRGDLPPQLARLNAAGTTPTLAVLLVGGAIAALVCIGNVKTTWSFSAFSVLIYYALTNLASLKLDAQERLYPQWVSWIGLLTCLLLAFWVDWPVWAIGMAIVLAGILWKAVLVSSEKPN